MLPKHGQGDDDSPRFDESTMKFPRSTVDAAALAALRATLPPLPALAETRASEREETARRDTPHTIVLPSVPPPDRATLTVLAGPDAGATFALDGADTVLWRARSAAIPIDEVSISRHHARIVREPDGRFVVEDLDSRNGTFVGGRRVTRCPLRSGDRVQIGRTCVLRFAIVDAVEDALQRRLYETSSRDELTGLANRRKLFEALGHEIARARAGEGDGADVALLMMDIDHFKRVNDAFGHLAGDQVLRAIAQAGQQALRPGDLFARYGGEELSVLLPGASASEALATAERLRLHLAAVRIEVGGGAVSITVSIGGALLSECTTGDDAVQQLVSRADERLYAAKLSGRNNTQLGV